MPRRKRRPRSKSAPAAVCVEKTGPSKRRQWANENMIAAMGSIKGGLSVKRAAELHGVPRATLQDRVKGKVMHGVNAGPQPYLQTGEEKELSCFLMEVAAVGYGKIKKQVKFLAEMVAKNKGILRSTPKNKAGKVSDGLFRRFMLRQKTITLWKRDPTAQVRMETCSQQWRI